MSLLLEALKKAEKAKEEAQRRTKGEPAATPAGTPLSLQEDSSAAAPKAEARPVLTRAELPDISQPLEILSDDFGPRSSPAPKPSLASTRPAAARPQPAVREAPARETPEGDRSAPRN
ncbi:MAG TPA: hypothetical protein VET66_06595, partial [Steroidobacteraceae bacterium]|nr:hypothetical protein [Steroidobacteraceae bacterium]